MIFRNFLHVLGRLLRRRRHAGQLKQQLLRATWGAAPACRDPAVDRRRLTACLCAVAPFVYFSSACLISHSILSSHLRGAKKKQPHKTTHTINIRSHGSTIPLRLAKKLRGSSQTQTGQKSTRRPTRPRATPRDRADGTERTVSRIRESFALVQSPCVINLASAHTHSSPTVSSFHSLWAATQSTCRPLHSPHPSRLAN